MPVAARDGTRRRTALGPRLGSGVHAAQYRVVERWDGVRIEHPLRHIVDLRIERWQFELSGASRQVRLSIFTAPIRLARTLAAMLLGLADAEHGAEFDVIRREAWMIAELIEPYRRRLLDRHQPDASAIEERMVRLRRFVPRLASSPVFYRTPYLARDVRRFPAAAIALAYLEDTLWNLPRNADDPRPTIAAQRRAMRNWRGLFSIDGRPYRSLDRTLMNLPRSVPPALLCELRFVRLERPMTDAAELLLLLQCVALARQRSQPIDWLPALLLAPPRIIRAGTQRVAVATGRTIDPLDPDQARFVAAYLLDAFGPAVRRFEQVVAHAIRRHQAIGHRRGLDADIDDLRHLLDLPARPSPDMPTAAPPAPPPAVAGLRFLATVGEVIEEGRRMGHCIGLYADRAVSGECFLFHAEHQGSTASIEVGAEGRVRQASGPRNRHNAACDWARRVLGQWIRSWPPPRDRA
ncbi:MAG: PcfJ domain-containing protein [Deltaproteobacteria bacterium]|nr:PcfJ domain-containing protein [Deltaproteobacteria bacterium]